MISMEREVADRRDMEEKVVSFSRGKGRTRRKEVEEQSEDSYR